MMSCTQQKAHEDETVRAENTASIQQLPEAALVNVLQHVPLQQRLASCALVCRAWAAAVASTTVYLEVETSSQAKWKQIQSYLQRCENQVASISILRPPRPWGRCFPLHLHCSKLAQLQSLRAEGVLLHLHTHSSRSSTRSSCSRSTALPGTSLVLEAPAHSAAVMPRDAAACAVLLRLQQLQLSSCWFSVQSFLQLSQLIGLTSLELTHLTLTEVRDIVNSEQCTAALSSVLQQLPKLVVLTLGVNNMMRSGPLPVLSSLQRLQRLDLDRGACSHLSEILQHLPTSLTALMLSGIDANLPPTDLAYTSRLHNLQELHLSHADVTPSVLSSPTSLRRLKLKSVGASVAAPADATEADQLAVLLAALGQHKQLQHLKLVDLRLASKPSPDLQCFTAITASSQLTQLFLESPGYEGFLPAAALEHMLPPGKQLPHLRTLQLVSSCGSSDPELAADAISTAGMECIAAGCPGLTKLALQHVIAPGADISCLRQLRPSLRKLSVAGDTFGDAAAAFVSKELTDLEGLSWTEAPVTDAGLQCLSNLRALTKLTTGTWEMGIETLRSTAAEGEQSDLWQQLAEELGSRCQL